jgi:hypothetical protein
MLFARYVLSVVLESPVASVAAIVFWVRQGSFDIAALLLDHLFLSSRDVLLLKVCEVFTILQKQLLVHEDEADSW